MLELTNGSMSQTGTTNKCTHTVGTNTSIINHKATADKAQEGKGWKRKRRKGVTHLERKIERE